MTRNPRGAHYEMTVVHPPPPGNPDVNSPFGYMGKYLGQRLCVELNDQRTIEAILCASDSAGCLFMSNAIVQEGQHRRTIEKVIIPLYRVVNLERIEDIRQAQGRRA